MAWARGVLRGRGWGGRLNLCRKCDMTDENVGIRLKLTEVGLRLPGKCEIFGGAGGLASDRSEAIVDNLTERLSLVTLL